MNAKRFIMAVVAAFAFVFVFEWVYHGVLLMDTYQATSDMWRPMGEEFSQYCAAKMASTFFMVFMMAYIFTCHYEGKGIGEGVRYGLYIGLLLAARDLGAYAYMPVEFSLVASWMLGALLTGLGAGATLAMVYRK